MARPAQIELRFAVLIDIAMGPAGILTLHLTLSHSLVPKSPLASGKGASPAHNDLAIFNFEAANLKAGLHRAFNGLGDVTLLERVSAAGHQPTALSRCCSDSIRAQIDLTISAFIEVRFRSARSS